MTSRKRSRIIILVVVAIGLIGSIITYNYLYKGHVTMADQEALFIGSAVEFETKILANDSEWNNKVVELSGDITALETKSITLNSSTYCQLDSVTTSDGLAVGQKINIKGKFIGYDDLLEEVKVSQCIIKE